LFKLVHWRAIYPVDSVIILGLTNNTKQIHTWFKIVFLFNARSDTGPHFFPAANPWPNNGCKANRQWGNFDVAYSKEQLNK